MWWLRSLFILAALIPSSVIAERANPLTIGTLFHLTGEFAVQGTAFQEGADLAAHEINAKGGIHGRAIELIHEDTEYRSIKTVSAAHTLLEQRGVDAVLISTATEVKAAGSLLQRHRVPTIVLWDSSPEIEKLGSFIFAIGPWTPASGEISAAYARQTLATDRAVVIDWNTEWSQSVSDYFRRRYTALGGTIAHTFTVNPDDPDFRSVLQRARELKPGVMYVLPDGNIPTFFRQVKQLQISIPLITSDIITEDLLAEDAPLYEGVLQSMSGDPDFPATKHLRELYRQHFGRTLTNTQYVAWAYDAVHLIANASGSAKNDGGDALRQSLLAARNFPGASGEISFSRNRSAPRPVAIYRIEKGRFVLRP